MKRIKIVALVLLAIFIVGFLVPEPKLIPVENAQASDWNQDTFWYEPWGVSGVHKGIDIFSPSGTTVLSSTNGVVLYQGEISLGGKIVVILGPKWRFHYYAHLNDITVNHFDIVSLADQIGTVGDTGNAKGKPPHLHYSIVTFIPYVWSYTNQNQGWKKMFYLDPGKYLKN